MDDFLAYFLAGMIGEELLRKIATRPYGFLILWLAGFFLIMLFFVILASTVIILGIFTDPAAQPSILRYVGDGVALTVVLFGQPAILLALGGGLLLALGYRVHYRNSIRDSQTSETKK